MALETTTVITGLNEANPTTGDAIQQGDDHIRLIKAVLKNCFPNVNAPLTASMIPNVPAGGIAATTLQAAINELDSEKAPKDGTGATGTWGISISGNANGISGTTPAAIPASALGTGTADGTKVLKGDRSWGALPSAESIPTGAVQAFAMSTPPSGWLKCNGAQVSRTTYANLFAAIGTTYGVGDGVNTFHLPDTRGRFVRSWADDGSIDSGRSIGSTQTDQNKSHSHTGSTNASGDHTHTVGSGASLNAQSSGGENSLPIGASNTGSAGNHSHTVTINADGGSEARPTNIAFMYCIKT